MKALRIHAYGASDVLKLEDIPTPQPGAGEVLVKIHAASINPIDYKIREGVRKGALPITMGRDFSGIVESLGAGASGFSRSRNSPAGRTALFNSADSSAGRISPDRRSTFRSAARNRSSPNGFSK